VKPRNQNINENESTGEDVFHQVRNQISDWLLFTIELQ
jgi:uncharacterized membrane protein